MRDKHIPAVVSIYRTSFVGAFLARLGPQFLHVMFRALIEGTPRECSLVCVDANNEVVGFVCGSQNRAAYLRSFLRRHLADSLPAVAAAAVRDPALVMELLRRIPTLSRDLYRSWRRPTSSLNDLPAASLMTIAVAGSWRNRGVGNLLVKAFMVAMANQRVPDLRLAVSEDNLKARHLYERLGWRPASVVRRSNSSNLYYIRSLIPAEIERTESSNGLAGLPQKSDVVRPDERDLRQERVDPGS